MSDRRLWTPRQWAEELERILREDEGALLMLYKRDTDFIRIATTLFEEATQFAAEGGVL